MSSNHVQTVHDREPPRSFVIQAIHRVVALPLIYDLAQFLAGARRTRAVLRTLLSDLPLDQSSVLDIGGGTGLSRELFPSTSHYACLDNDPQKLMGLRAKHPDAEAIEGSAAQIPTESSKYDVAVICAVTHHLTDEDLSAVVTEAARVLRPDGRLLFLDAVWEPLRLRGRILWRLDRGSHPRTYEALRTAFTRLFSVEKERRWAIHHEYVAWLLAPKAAEVTA